MFVKACNEIRETIYGLMGLSQTGPKQGNATNGTGFMIAPGVLATAAHFCHVQNDPTKPVHQVFEAIRSPDIGQKMETATLVVEDTTRDLALFRIAQPRSNKCVSLHIQRVPTGTPTGSLGFPLASVVVTQSGRMFNLQERFQSASISSFGTMTDPAGRQLGYYETDSLMYGGSSGCPGFLDDAEVFGMHVASVVDKPSASTAVKSGARLAIAIWVPASDIRDLARANGIAI